MEEILASIRKIIADEPAVSSVAAEQGVATSVPEPPSELSNPQVHVLRPDPPPQAASAPDVARLQPARAEAAQTSPQTAQPSVAPPLSPEKVLSPAQNGPAVRAGGDQYRSLAPRGPGPSGPGPGGPTEIGARSSAALSSSATDQSVSAAFSMLAATRLADNSENLLDMTRELIRPLLKAWLDDNLPTMVERMVRAEIERVARGGR